MGGIWAIILAAGESTRMKVPKMLLLFDGVTMIGKVIENVSRSEVTETIVVLGSYSEEIMEVIKAMPVGHCYNRSFREGMLSSVLCGIRNVPADARAVVVFPGDQPFIPPEVTNSLIGAHKSTGKGIVIPVYRKKRGHPILIDCKYRQEIELICHDEGLRALASRYPGDVLEVETDSPGVLKDFDTKEDYLNEINQMK